MKEKRKNCRFPMPTDGKCMAATDRVCKIKYCVFNRDFPVFRGYSS